MGTAASVVTMRRVMPDTSPHDHSGRVGPMIVGMKILYGVVGEGMGHAMRSRVVVQHLLDEGHEVQIMTSQRAVEYLSRHFADVRAIHGLHILYEDNRVRLGKTLWSNVRDGLSALPAQIKSYFNLIESFAPELVISDFESWSYLYAKAHGLPVISVDNQQIINRCTHADAILEGERTNFELTRAFVKGKLPFCSQYLVTTFFYPPLRKEHTTLVPPIVRPEILRAKAKRGDHLLVYQTAEGHGTLVDALRATGLECRVYGLRRGLTSEQVDGNLRFQPFSEDAFIADLASARAVIAGGGFTLMSESVYLRKPMLAVPVAGQFEQVINARYLQALGYGRCESEVSVTTIRAFLDGVDTCTTALEGYTQDGNQTLFSTLDGLIDRAAGGVL